MQRNIAKRRTYPVQNSCPFLQKNDMLHLVVTLTIFWNYGKWNGARSLHEMFRVQDKSILDYVSDYKLNLIVPEEINLLNVCLDTNLNLNQNAEEELRLTCVRELRNMEK